MARSSTVGLERDLTLEAWAALPEDEPGELVDGRMEVEEVPTRVHEAVVFWLLYRIGGWAQAHGARVYGSELKLAVAPRRGRKPDINLFFRGTPRSSGRATLQRHPPDLVVEVVSATPADARRDRIDKPDDYARAGVRYYWLVDPELRSFEVWERDDAARYARALAATAGTVSPPGLAGLELDLDDLWREVERELAEGEPEEGTP
jgi:Uma2 family endonuclease